MLFALRLVQIRRGGDNDFEKLFDKLLRGSTLLNTSLSENLLEGKLSASQLAAIEDLDKVSYFRGLVSSMKDEPDSWLAVLDHPNAEAILPTPWRENCLEISKEAAQLMKMMVIRILRPDRLV